ncbi:MAG: hypothetical protein MUE36_08185 [Acidimicrobiales bacterium]|jgi:hypothetical protein|nr:hypothetical protein [Acidimicrobiales bacterium]
MADVLYVLTVLVAFAALVGLVRLCDRLVGPDETAAAITGEPTDVVDR